jgi:sugar-specific transcriptional regulator TrmB
VVVPDADHLTEIQEFGLSHQEALLYSQLVALGPPSAREVSERLHMSREDSYRILKRLESRGLVQLALGNPSIFMSVEPRAAINSFISNLDVRSDALKEKAYILGAWLETIKGTASHAVAERVHHESAAKVVWGRQVFVELQKLVATCSTQYEGVFSTDLFKRDPKFGILEFLPLLIKRGVKVRVVTEVTPETLETVRRYSKIFPIKAHVGVSQGMRFSIIDRSRIQLALTEPSASDELTSCLCSTIPTLAKGLGMYFDKIWTDSLPVTEPVRHVAKRGVSIS